MLSDLAAPMYMSVASNAPLTASSRRGLRQFERSYDARRPWDAWVQALEDVRSLAARMLRSSPDEVALPGSASAGLASFLGGLPIEGTSIIVARPSFAGVSQVCWAQASRGVHVVDVPLGQARESIERLHPTAVVLPHVERGSGRVVDVEPLIRAAADVGAASVVDCSHTLGNFIPPSADVVLASGYKFLFGVPGVAVMVVRRRWSAQSVPTTTGWFAAEDVLAMDLAYRPAAGARRFESGAPSFPSVFVLRETMRTLHELGPAIGEHRRHVRAALGPLMTDDAGDDFAYFPLESSSPSLLDVLSMVGCVSGGMGGRVRLAPSIANTVEEVEHVVAHLRRRAPDVRLVSKE